MNSNEVQQKWIRAEDLAPPDLASARVQLHHALQLVADAGRKLGFDGDTEFLAAVQGLGTDFSRGSDGPFRVALGIADFALHVTDRDGASTQDFPLEGKTYAEGVAWLKKTLDGLGADGAKITGKTPYDIPPHKVADGAPFAPPPPAVWRKLAAYYANAWRVLTYLSEITPDCSAPRCSSETLAYEGRLSPIEDVELAIGFRPGDELRDEPFHYVAILPRPKIGEDEIDELDELEGGGEWVDDDWFGAVQTGSAYTIYDSESVQAASATSFFDSALEQSKRLIGLGEEE